MKYDRYRVGKFYLLSEFLYCHSAVELGLPNHPPAEGSPEWQGIQRICEKILDPVAEEFGKPTITYGYVNPQIAGRVRGYVSDLHQYRPPGMIGGAADIAVHGASHLDVAEWIAANLEFDRIIVYPGSSVICTAWTSKPRKHFKMWGYRKGRKQYLDFSRQEIELSDRLCDRLI